MSGLSGLVGVRVRRVDGPLPGLLALKLFSPELRSVLLLRVTGERVGVGLVSDRPQGLSATSFVQKLRKELENARVAAFEQPEASTLALVLVRSEQATRLVCDFARGTFALERAGTVLIRTGSSSHRRTTHEQVAWPTSIEALTRSGERLIAQQAAEGLDAQKSALARIVRAAQKKLQRRLVALEGDIARAADATPLRARANLLMTQQHAVRRGQASVQVTDFSLDPPTQVTIELDPKRPVSEQIEAWFKQARRFERGAQLASQRSQTTSHEIAELEQLLTSIATAEESELDPLAERARAFGLAGVGRALTVERDHPRAKKQAPQKRQPYRQFVSWRERAILVGKNAHDNDALTREHARPQDLWLHARATAGAHVIVPLQRNEPCPEELLLDAAHLAAHFSDARAESTVEVSYTNKRYVRKPRGSASGQVVLEREKVITLQVEPARIERLLGRERRD